MTLKKALVRVLLPAFFVTLAIVLAIGWSTYSDTMRIHARCDVSAPDINFRDRSDSLLIAARYTQVENDNGVVILIHGLDTCKDDPRLIATERAYQGMQYSTLAIDMRSHGSSEDGGQFHGFGSQRANDILGAFDWLTEQGVAANRITLHGQSLGGSAALLAALQEPRISRVVAEDPILNFDQIVSDGGAPDWFLPIFKLTGRFRGFDLSQQPVDLCRATSSGQNVLVLHVVDDPVTPISQLDFITPNNETCRTHRITGDWHIGWAAQQPLAFEMTLVDWLTTRE